MRSTFLICTILLFISGCKQATVEAQEESPLKISLAQWSLNKQFFSGELTTLDFAQVAADMGFEGIEYVNQFFMDKAEDFIYLDSLILSAENAGVQQLLIMVDGEGALADPDPMKRAEAVENHKKWVRAASYLGCHSIRVNLFGSGDEQTMADAAVEGLLDLSEIAAEQGINIIVENHGGYSSNAKWLADIMLRVKKNNVGTLPDFGNFCVKREGGAMWGAPCVEEYDKYLGVKELMPFAKAVSAKAHDFNDEGEEAAIDYSRMIELVKDAGFKGFIGVEFEGNNLPAMEGIKKTKALIEKYL